MQADSKVKLARASMPVVEAVAYLDTGSVGPVSSVYAGTLARCTEEDQRAGRALIQRFDRIDVARAALRTEIAALLAAQPAEIELTQGTADAIRTLVDRYPWERGDEIVSTQLEYPACADAIRGIAESGHVTLRIAEAPAANADDLGWLERCVTPKTRLIAFSGVAFTTGQRLPIEHIAAFASARGIDTLVDGAQLIGAGELRLDTMPVDFVALPLQKWLCGPEGLGALFARESSTGLLPGRRNAVQGWPVLEAAVSQLQWMRETLGWDWIHSRVQALNSYARSALGDREAADIVTPDACAGLLSFRCDSHAVPRILDRFESARIIVRHRPELDLFRISTAFFNVEDEVDRCVAALL
jgi:L-cysteine/cystine lyase